MWTALIIAAVKKEFWPFTPEDRKARNKAIPDNM